MIAGPSPAPSAARLGTQSYQLGGVSSLDGELSADKPTVEAGLENNGYGQEHGGDNKV